MTHRFGLASITAEDLDEKYQDAAAALGYDEGVRIWMVMPPAIGNVLEGDRILYANSKEIESSKDMLEVLDSASETGNLLLRVQSGNGGVRSLRMKGVLACDFSAGLVDDDAVNAFADGSDVYVTKGMVRFADSENELALVLGHEFAHNILGHVTQHRTTAIVGMGLGLILDLAAAASGINTEGGFTKLGGQLATLANQTFSQDFEKDADYMGVYLARRAGFDVSDAPDFWRRMAAEYPASIESSMMRSHPSSPERSAALTSAVAEIARKEAADLPLAPSVRD